MIPMHFNGIPRHTQWRPVKTSSRLENAPILPESHYKHANMRFRRRPDNASCPNVDDDDECSHCAHAHRGALSRARRCVIDNAITAREAIVALTRVGTGNCDTHTDIIRHAADTHTHIHESVLTDYTRKARRARVPNSSSTYTGGGGARADIGMPLFAMHDNLS